MEEHAKEKSRVDEIRLLQNKREDIMRKIAAAERRRETDIVADLRYGALPDIENRIQSLDKEIKNEKKNSENK